MILDLIGVANTFTDISHNEVYLSTATLEDHNKRPSLPAYFVPEDVPESCVEHVVFSKNDTKPIIAHASDYGDPRKIILDTLNAVHMEEIPFRHPDMLGMIAMSYPNFNGNLNKATVMVSRHMTQDKGNAYF